MSQLRSSQQTMDCLSYGRILRGKSRIDGQLRRVGKDVQIGDSRAAEPPLAMVKRCAATASGLGEERAGGRDPRR